MSIEKSSDPCIVIAVVVECPSSRSCKRNSVKFDQGDPAAQMSPVLWWRQSSARKGATFRSNTNTAARAQLIRIMGMYRLERRVTSPNTSQVGPNALSVSVTYSSAFTAPIERMTPISRVRSITFIPIVPIKPRPPTIAISTAITSRT